ncbi:hypothetical protein DMENIID0001_019330 [Sergentomyia squamirostris]
MRDPTSTTTLLTEQNAIEARRDVDGGGRVWGTMGRKYVLVEHKHKDENTMILCSPMWGLLVALLKNRSQSSADPATLKSRAVTPLKLRFIGGS